MYNDFIKFNHLFDICDYDSVTSYYTNKISETNPMINDKDIEQLNKFKNMMNFHYTNSQLFFIPDCIYNYKNLKILNLSHNYINFIPHDIKFCKNLTEIYLDHNKIDKIHNLCTLKNLKIMSLNDNQIEEVPEAICQLKNLKYLFLSNNFIEKYSKGLELCKDLFYFDFIPQKNNKEIPKKLIYTIHNGFIHANFYNNADTVHQVSIQTSIKKCIHHLKILNSMISDENLKDIRENLKNVSILEDNINDKTKLWHSDVNYYDVYMLVSNIIYFHKDKTNLIEILDEELENSKNSCFTGKISCLINTLSGFVDSIKISISESEQISTIINKLLSVNSDKQKILKEFSFSMMEYGYTWNIINSYLKYLDDYI